MDKVKVYKKYFIPGEVYEVLQDPSETGFDVPQSVFPVGSQVRFKESRSNVKEDYVVLLFELVGKGDELVVTYYESDPEPAWEDFFR